MGDKRRSEVAFHQLDITNEESCRTFAEHLKNKHGQIGVVINNAGYKTSKLENYNANYYFFDLGFAFKVYFLLVQFRF